MKATPLDPSGRIVIGWKISLKLREEIKKIALRETRDAQEILEEALENYVKIHGEGNPIYSLEKYMDPNFKATPAFLENLKTNWIPYLQISNNESLDEVISQARAIMTYSAAYRSLKPEERKIWFDQRTASHMARFDL